MKAQRLFASIGVLTVGLLLISGAAAVAQLETGNLYGKVTDQGGTALPGVTVTLDTGEAPKIQVTNAAGEFRFLNLAPANYRIKAELQGFSPVEYPRIIINVGRNTNIEVTMNSAVEDVITVTSESPLLDEHAIRTGGTISQTELQKIPTSRDPWSVLQSTPGVLTDRINVGGNMSGQQDQYIGPGSFGNQSVWSVDGVVITDMAALGSSPAYYDFDSFEEMQISTGGSDTTIATGGVVLNMVSKRGTNEYRGSARYYDTPGSVQSSTSLKKSDLPPAQQPSFLGGANKINYVEDYGAEAGGPILKDHLWLWGAYGRQLISVQTLPSPATPQGVRDRTDIPDWNGKLNAQITSGNSATFVGFNSNKKKHGRNASPTRPQETTWDQGQFGGSPTLLKAEDTQIFNPNLYLTLLYSHVYGGFSLIPEGGIGPGTPLRFTDATGVNHNTFYFQTIKRPQIQGKGDASTFFNTGNVSNELKYGASYRTAESSTNIDYPGGGWILDPTQVVGARRSKLPAGDFGLYLTRAILRTAKLKYESAYLQDTVTTGNLTANIGLRYDIQKGVNEGATVPANQLRPDLLPAVAYPGGDIGFKWKGFSPRLGLTYALGKDRRTLLRASYARFLDQLGSSAQTGGEFLNPLGGITYYYAATTNHGDGHVTPAGIIPVGLGYSANTTAANPTVLAQPNRVSSSLTAPKTDEFLLSAEHALLPEFVVGVNLTFRQQRDLLEQDLLVSDDGGQTYRASTRADYAANTQNVQLPNGSIVPVTWYTLKKPGPTTNKGFLLRNGDYQTTYKGASLTFNKRLSNRWMLRGNVTYSDWYYNKAGNRPDPTVLLAGGVTDGNYVAQGDQVLQGSGNGSGAFGFVFVNSKWSFATNALYQVAPDRPWGFNVAGNLTGRQGYPDPYFLRVGGANGSAENVQVGAADSNRLDKIIDFDARIEKEFTFQDFGLTLGVDCFNVFNQSFILQRRDRVFAPGTPAATANAGYVFEVLSPRVFRFGARLSFK
jgi:hypothetical protein